MTDAIHPPVVAFEEWQAARERMLAKEKEATQARDKLNAERRKLPMYLIDKDYTFSGPEGEVSLLDLFAGKKQLLLYHFMFDTDWEQGCNGCSMVVDNICHPAHLHARDVNFVLVSVAPLSKLESFKQRMGWTLPWYSSAGNEFNKDIGVTTENGETFGLSVFFQHEGKVYRTYYTDARGVEYLGSSFSLLDLVPYGRQEDWEDSPEGWPQGPRYKWWKHHDRY